MRDLNIVEDAAIPLELARIAARLPATPSAGAALRKCLGDPPKHGTITLKFGDGKLYRVVKEESF